MWCLLIRHFVQNQIYSVNYHLSSCNQQILYFFLKKILSSYQYSYWLVFSQSPNWFLFVIQVKVRRRGGSVGQLSKLEPVEETLGPSEWKSPQRKAQPSSREGNKSAYHKGRNVYFRPIFHFKAFISPYRFYHSSSSMFFIDLAY